MKARVSSSICAAGMLALCTAAFAQAGQEPQQPPPGARTSAGGQITVTGCVQREADYRRARDAGKGGVAGTGVGAGNEFILSDASASSSTKAGSEPSSPTATTGASSATAYELTGPSEGKVGEFVGKRVEITGMLKAAEVSAGGQPTGGASAGKPPAGVDVTSKDLRLRELEVSSVRETTGTCPAVK